MKPGGGEKYVEGEKSQRPDSGQKDMDAEVMEKSAVTEEAGGCDDKLSEPYCIACGSGEYHIHQNCLGFAFRRCAEGCHLVKDCSKSWYC